MSFSQLRAAYEQLTQTTSLDSATDRNTLLTQAAWSVNTVRAMEQPLLDAGEPLMKYAAQAVAASILTLLQQHNISAPQAHIGALIGGGNNGGDGLFAVAQCAHIGATVTIYCTTDHPHHEGLIAAQQAGCRMITIQSTADIEQAIASLQEVDVIVDALAGIGITGALRGIAGELVQRLAAQQTQQHATSPHAQQHITTDKNNLHSTQQPRHRGLPPVIAVDTPSGIGVDDGTLPGAHLNATLTLACGVLKPCHLLPPASYSCGTILVADLGFNLDISDPRVLAADMVASWPLRPTTINDSKYSRGVVGLITGSLSYPGAALLSTQAAARSGAGMVRYCGPAEVSSLIMQHLPEAVLMPGRVQAWVVGSGIPDHLHAQVAHEGDREQRQQIVTQLHHTLLSSSHHQHCAYISDAGSLDVIAQLISHADTAHIGQHTILTPHASECAALINILFPAQQPVSAQDIEAAPLHFAITIWRTLHTTVLLKGAHTIIVGGAEGSEPTILVASNACNWMATAGSGDVLAGLLGGIAASAVARIEQTTLPAQTTADDTDHDIRSTLLTQLLPCIAASGAHWHGYAGRLASSADRTVSVVYPPVHIQHAQPALQAWMRTNMLNTGHPILASDMIARIPAAIQAAYGMSQR